MPKSYFNKQTSWVKDDRDRDFSFVRVADRRRVTFKQNRHGGKKEYQNRDWSNAIREHLQDDDVDMGFSSGSGRNYNKKFQRGNKGGRRGSPIPNGRRKLLESPSNWYKITLPYGDKYEKSFIQKTLLDKITPLQFWPVAWQVSGKTCTFYVDDYKVAEKLQGLDRQIQLPDGFRQIIKVTGGSPNVDMNVATKEKIKLVMAKRYNSATKALDLSKFHADPDLQDYFCALSKPIVFLSIIEIIAENIPELEALNLFDNKIAGLSFFKKAANKIPNLKILHIGNNKLREISQLDSLQGLPVVDLVLDGNPLCDKYKDQAVYIRYEFEDERYITLGLYGSLDFSVYSEVRKRFPKCVKLDGIDLPPPISFDIVDEHHLPNPQQTFLCNSEGTVIVRQFLEQYFLIFDSENRQPLLQAYHENAMYSMTMGYPYALGKDKSVSWLNWYATDNRNIMRVTDPDRRNKLLRQGQLAVVSFLSEIPQTKHDINSFTVDLMLFTPQMLCLTVTGLFKELKTQRIPPLRYFFRTLVIVPAGSGFCIANEVVHITNATPDQAKDAFKTPVALEPVPVVPAASVSSPGGPGVPHVVPVPDDATKKEMVQQMATQSGMNLEWSLKCLEETQWDFQRATLIFQQLHSQGVIPQEAFVK